MKGIEIYKNISLQKIDIEDVSIGLRQVGTGNDLVFIHGFPTHGYTWRKLLPELSKTHKCHILDLPGLGESSWAANTDFKSEAQARYVTKLLAKLGIEKYSIIAHNSGATIARAIAINQPKNVENLILLNTEIPNHRPPWIPFYQKIGLLPSVPFAVRILFRQSWFVKSPMGLKELYSDKSMLNNKSNIVPYLNPVINSQQKAIGAFRYLKGIDWQLIDDFKSLHKKITANVLFLWGEDDKTFPIGLGKEMAKQFTCHVDFVTIKKASLLPHEEKPEVVVREILRFLGKGKN
ncbi:MAG: alpha/beta fold hydrolase [Chitinophagales bacterium]